MIIEKPEWHDVAHDLDLSWKSTIQAILEDVKDRTPGNFAGYVNMDQSIVLGSFVETKDINFTWHYRNADPDFGENQKNELLLHLRNLPNMPIDILVGKMSVEVRPQGINKVKIIIT
jgi:trehalose 6-phosphate synthase/phosphatase